MGNIAKPKVLLLGDSIRLSYQPIVTEKLKSVADVVGPSKNCQYSLYTLSSLKGWLEEFGNVNVIHWNNGLHDVGHNPSRFPVQIPIEMYCANIEFILKRLLETRARVIWATTTPVHLKRPFLNNQWSWKNNEIEQYNSEVLNVMKKYKIHVNDLHSIVMSDIDRYLCEDQLHLSESGRNCCAEAVTRIIKSYLK